MVALQQKARVAPGQRYPRSRLSMVALQRSSPPNSPGCVSMFSLEHGSVATKGTGGTWTALPTFSLEHGSVATSPTFRSLPREDEFSLEHGSVATKESIQTKGMRDEFSLEHGSVATKGTETIGAQLICVLA